MGKLERNLHAVKQSKFYFQKFKLTLPSLNYQQLSQMWALGEISVLLPIGGAKKTRAATSQLHDCGKITNSFLD